MRRFFLKNKNRGFTLVETLIAISIFSTSILALIVVLAQSISNTNYAKSKMIATYLAQEGIESIRDMRDTYVLYTPNTTNDWGKFDAKISPCNPGNECGFNNSLNVTDNAYIFKCSSDPNNCKLYLSNGNYNATGTGNYSGFIRKVWMVPVGANEIKIFSMVSWTQGSGSYSMTFSESLFNWFQ